MSMKDYAVEDYGMLLYDEDVDLLVSEVCDLEPDEDKKYALKKYVLYDYEYCEYISEFTGEAFVVDDNGTTDWSGEESFNCDSLCYVPLKKWSTLFKPAYKDMDEIVQELEDSVGVFLPDDFDYRGRIRKIVGTYYG